MGWTAGNRGFVTGGASTISTGSISSSGANRLLRALAFIGTGGTPADPSSVVWDAAGVNEAFTSFQAGTTFNTNFRGNPWHRKAPTAKSAVCTATWASSHDEVMLICDAFDAIDQTTTNRTPPASATGSSKTPTINVTSVATDIVVGSVCFGTQNGDLTTIASSSMTIREKIEGADMGGFEACCQGTQTASGTTTTVGANMTSASTPSYLIFGVSLIAAASSIPFNVVQQSGLSLAGTLALSGSVTIRKAFLIAAASAIPLAGTLALSGDVQIHSHLWRIPTNIPPGTSVHVIIFGGSISSYSILAQGDAVVDASGNVDIGGDGFTPGTQQLALVHNYDDVPTTTSIFGGPCIATLISG